MAKKKPVEDKYIGRTFIIITNKYLTYKRRGTKVLKHKDVRNNPTVKVIKTVSDIKGYYYCSVVGKREAFLVHKSTLVTSSAFKKLQKEHPAKYYVEDSIQIEITGKIRKDTIEDVYYKTRWSHSEDPVIDLIYWLKEWTTNSRSEKELYPEDYVFEEHTVVYLEKDNRASLLAQFYGGPCGGRLGSALNTRTFRTRDAAQDFIERNVNPDIEILLIKGEVIPIDISTKVSVSLPENE